MTSVEALLETLSNLVVELDAASGRPSREVWKLAARTMVVRRRAAEAARRLRDGGRSARSRLVDARLEALSNVLMASLRSCGADGLSHNEERNRLLDFASSGKDDARETTASLVRTRDMLAAGLEQISGAHSALDQDEAALKGVESYQKRINDAMRSARRLVRSITRRDQRERLGMQASLCVFYCIVAYIVFRRLPFKSLISVTVKVLVGALKYAPDHTPTEQAARLGPPSYEL